jgi:hypothetical protein
MSQNFEPIEKYVNIMGVDNENIGFYVKKQGVQYHRLRKRC